MVQASSATGFLSTVGINTSITMIGSAYQNYAQMMNALAYLDVTRVRDTYDNPYTTAEFARMASQLPLKFDFFVALGSASPEWQLEQIKSNPGIVSFVEGYNESDSWWQTFHGETGAAATRAAQNFIDTTVKADPTLSGVGVIQATFASPSGFAAYGDMAAAADYASTHTYFGTGNNPLGSFATMIAQAQTVSPGLPTITTEAGYDTTLGNKHGVSELVQAKYELNLLFEQAKAGVALTYLWGLVDNYADPAYTNRENHYGLFHNDWTPKTAAIALHNALAIMTSTSSAGINPQSLQSLDFSFDALPSSVQSSLFSKADGTLVLVVWNDVRLSGPTVQADIQVAPIATTLQLGQSFRSIAVLDPLVGTTALQRFSDVASLSLQVLDHPIFIELSQSPTLAIDTDPIARPGQILTNPLQTVGVHGLSVAAGSSDMVTVEILAGAAGLSVLDTDGHLLADHTDRLHLTGSAATVNAELATLTYTGGALGLDTITISATIGTAAVIVRTVPVRIEAGTTATNSGGPAVSVPSTFTCVAGTEIAIPRMVVSDTFAATHAGTVSLNVTVAFGTVQVKAGGSIIGNGTSSLSLVGSFSDVSAAFASLHYTGAPNSRRDVVTCTVVDQEGFSSVGVTAISLTEPAQAVVAPPVPASVPMLVPVPVSSLEPVNMPAAAPMIPSQAAAPIAVPKTPVTPAVTGTGVRVFRFFDSQSGTQFLTSSTAERDNVLRTRPDLVSEGVGIGAITEPGDDANTAAVYRFFDTGSGTHFYTSSAAERDATVASRSDLIFEGANFFEHLSAVAGDVAVYRFFDTNNGTHFYTSSVTERATILGTRSDLVAEGIAFYAPQA